MKKYLFIIATIALLASCAEKDSFKEVVSPDVEIGFSTFTGKLTRAENSSATSKNSLETYQTSFKVWSSKYVNSTPAIVFDAKKVESTLTTPAVLYTAEEAIEYNAGLTGAFDYTNGLTDEQATAYNEAINPTTAKVAGNILSEEEAAAYNATLAGAVSAGDIKTAAVYNWTYSPLVFWDKSATKYDFYAAAPADLNWAWDNENKKLSLDNFSVDGVTIAASSTVDAKAVFGDKDIMISEDITEHKTFTSAKVNLSFIHILSRLNIGVKKASPILDDFIVKLESVKVYNMKSNGKFNENSHDAEATGNNSRWIKPTDDWTYFTNGVGYATETEITTDYNYVYQALAIPQTITYEANILLNGSNVSTSSKPYLKIAYEIWTKDEYYTANDPEVIAGTKQTTDVKVDSYKTGEYNYTYNLADLFNGDGATTSVEFNEGWMNTLKITINPEAIEFDADVYEWAPETPVEVDVPDANTGN